MAATIRLPIEGKSDLSPRQRGTVEKRANRIRTVGVTAILTQKSLNKEHHRGHKMVTTNRTPKTSRQPH